MYLPALRRGKPKSKVLFYGPSYCSTDIWIWVWADHWTVVRTLTVFGDWNVFWNEAQFIFLKWSNQSIAKSFSQIVYCSLGNCGGQSKYWSLPGLYYSLLWEDYKWSKITSYVQMYSPQVVSEFVALIMFKWFGLWVSEDAKSCFCWVFMSHHHYTHFRDLYWLPNIVNIVFMKSKAL